jgi:glutathione synthase/RimK-type ligase-like ATP-grasp enzyme
VRARCTFATYGALPELDPDDRLAASELERRGVEVRAAVWNDPAVDWSAEDVCVLRSTWDYPQRPNAFVRWIDDVALVSALWNPAAVVRWNLNKRYLLDLGERGVPIVPTALVSRGTPLDLVSLMRARGWSRAVVKPAFGAGTVGVRKAGDSGASRAVAQAHADLLLRDQDALVQRYLPSVESYRERALVFVDDAYSHAVAKSPFQALLPAGEAGEALVEATAEEIALARTALAAAPGPRLYARVDLVRDDEGAPVVIEVELVEPSLFLAMHPPAAAALADAIHRRLSG